MPLRGWFESSLRHPFVTLEKSYNFLLGLACHLVRPTAFTPKSMSQQPVLFVGVHVRPRATLGLRLTIGRKITAWISYRKLTVYMVFKKKS